MNWKTKTKTLTINKEKNKKSRDIYRLRYLASQYGLLT
jgi:hypothetical protein